ncbi:tetratricopeptide repeat protein 17-like [Amphibalanus amphitrite]|uniref:tetratricopeptide repeat protein 17-like n=1 Tax=Amphibalanus amphitrite TaxID=1232801 RepID=UPI001C91AA82|nr:tetratricopeptide repeat protein 17-like [Amphibalanus amphitrite]
MRPDDETAETAPEPDDEQEPPLDCGKSVNFTHYDHLVGVSNRQRHPALVPEPHAGLVFRRRGDRASDTIDLDVLEKKLRRSKREKPKSLQLYNQIGNFWRVKGDASKAIECFRRSLAVSPNNAEVLLNLARVLFNLQYLDDAIFLTRRSLEVQPPDQNAWLQHFTLGEILKVRDGCSTSPWGRY